jgi:hypothetical protein
MLRIFLFFIPIALCLFEYILFRYSSIFRESEALLLDSQIQWMLSTTIAIWCASFIVLRFKLDDMWLVGLLLIAIFMYFANYLSAFQPTKAIILLAGVTLGKGSAFFFNDKNSRRIFDNSFALPQSNEIQRDLILILILLLSLTSWCHLDMTGSIYHGPRWMGLWDNPNIYGMLMGAGVVLAIGLLAAKGRKEHKENYISPEPSSKLCSSRGDEAQTEENMEPPYVGCYKENSDSSPRPFLRSLRSFAAKDVFRDARNMARDSWNSSLRIFLFIAAGMMAVGLVMSYSRGAWLATTIGLLYLAWCYGKLKWRWVLPVILVVAAVVCVFWHSTADNGPWYLKRLDFSRPSAQHRVSAWRGGLQMMRDHPLGVGWNRTVGVYDKNYSPPEDSVVAITTNAYLMLGTELGLPGLLCFVTYVGLCFRVRRSAVVPTAGCGGVSLPIATPGGTPGAPADETSALRCACRAGAVVLLVAFWFDGGLFDLPTAAVFWILLELGTSNLASNKNGKQPTRP